MDSQGKVLRSVYIKQNLHIIKITPNPIKLLFFNFLKNNINHNKLKFYFFGYTTQQVES